MNKIQLLRAVAAAFVIFFFILLGMNTYQYFKLKRGLAAGMVQELGATEKRELQLFFTDIEENLLLIRDWGINDVLLSGDLTNLNKKLIPFLARAAGISGIVMASNDGREYFIYKEGGNYITRIATVTENQTRLEYTEWSPDVTAQKNWVGSGSYDSSKRPWFKAAVEDTDIHWSGPYLFFESRKPGITVSTSLKNGKNASATLVLGMDITLAEIKKIFTKRDAERPGILFVVRSDGTLLTAGLNDDTNVVTDTNDDALTYLVDSWRQGGYLSGTTVQVKSSQELWFGSFQKIEHGSGEFWLGLALSEKELSGWFDRTLFKVDVVEIFIGLGGVTLLLALMWQLGFLRTGGQKTIPPDLRLLDYINEGEGALVEFKSTVRMNLKAGKSGKEIELAWLKGVVAFLNSSGGTVLLGVDDSGKICGIEEDRFESDDRCLLHIKNLLNQHVGPQFSSFISANLVPCEEKQVVMLECRSAVEAVFLKIGKNEEFYVRSGPSSVKLTPSQMVSYVRQKK